MSTLISSERPEGARFRKILHFLGGTLGLLLFCLPVFSQGDFGRILGTVTDQSSGVVAGATVTVIDTERGVARVLTTDESGEYNAPNLTPSVYTVRVEAPGFKKLEHQKIEVEVGKEVRVDLTVQPGEQEQTVTVNESLPLVETTNATLGGTLNNADISDMPLNGRNYQNLLSLRPGITVQAGGGPWTQSTNGVRPDESAWMVDGVINANFYDSRPVANMPSAFTDGATILPIDAIQEFDLQENPKAEYGWKPGAVVNVGIKSGNNSLHGSAYAFGRSDSWDARNSFDPAPADKLPARLEQFGSVIGGPIKKDKLFFLGGYEGLRSFIGNALVTGGTPETVAQGISNPKTSFVDAITSLQNAGVPISPVSLNLAGCKLGPPVTCSGSLFPNNPGTTTGFTSTFPNTNTSDNGVGKIDYHINDKNTVHGLFLVGHYDSLGEDHPFLNQLFEDHNPISTYTASGSWDWTPNSRMVNEVRFAYNKVNFAFVPNDANLLADGSGLTGGAGFPVNTGIASPGGLPNINISGFQSLGTQHNRPFDFHNPYYDGQDSLSYLMGKHTFKFGVEIAHINVNSASFETARGRIDFQGGQSLGGTSTPLQDFFAGDPSRGFLLGGDPTRTTTWDSYAGFAQDDWRLTPKLTINLGLRYSYVSPFEETNGQFGSFSPTQGLVQQSQLGGSLYKPDTKDFSPRLGFAWDVTGKGTTVVRGGFNIIYSAFTIATLLQEVNFQNSTAVTIAAVPTGACNVAVPVGQTCAQQPGGQTFGGTITLANNQLKGANLNWDPTVNSNPGLNGGKVFPNGVVPSCTATSKCNIESVDPNLKTPFVTAWNFGVTHAFNNNLSLEVEYVGDHGSRLTGFVDLNQPTTQGVFPLAAKFPYLGFVNQFVNDTRSNYNGLQSTLTERLSRGVSFTAGYTYSHGLDNGSLNRNGFLPQDSANPGADYSSGDFDIRHRFTLTATYDLPSIKGNGQLLEGWKVNAIITEQSGQPWTVWDTQNNFSSGVDSTGAFISSDNTDRWDFFGNPSDFKSGGANSIPYCISAANCTITSGVTGAQTLLPNSGALFAECQAKAASQANLQQFGCFVSGNSVLTPPANNTFGNLSRNAFRDLGFNNVDFSIFKSFSFKERYNAQFRAEFFNIFNHPNYANPYGSIATSGIGDDPGGNPKNFGCGCATPDVLAGNPLVGSGSARVMQLGLKLGF